MAEYIYTPIQTVQSGQAVLFANSITCNKGYVYHREGSGNFSLRGIVNNPCCCFARYQVTFNGNIALPTGATVEPISLALAIDGEPLQSSTAIFTPAATDEYGNVTSTAIITVPKGCCFSLSVENNSVGATVNPAINVQNANIVIDRIA